MPERRDQLDEALDEALASYGEAPANEGLERRILARVSGRPARKHLMRPLAVAVGAAAMVAITFLFWWEPPKIVVQTSPARTVMPTLRNMEAPPVRTVPAPESAAVLTSAAKPRKIWKKPEEPKLLQFPTPSPLTSEERALIRLVTRNEKDIPRELTYFSSPIKPIQITAIEIRPLP